MTTPQPIASAPEGERILVNPFGEWQIFVWYPQYHLGKTGAPTHWCPLPPMPQS
jgi:hypothetical protein